MRFFSYSASWRVLRSQSDLYFFLKYRCNILNSGLLGGCLCCSKRLLISGDHRILKCGTELRVNGMHDITVGIVGIFAAGHDNEKAISCMNDLDIMHS